MLNPQSHSAISAATRRWCRLHISTWILLAAAAAGWVLAIVPGDEPGDYDPWREENIHSTRWHGFPAIFLRRELTKEQEFNREKIESCWALGDHVVEFCLWPLMGDV